MALLNTNATMPHADDMITQNFADDNNNMTTVAPDGRLSPEMIFLLVLQNGFFKAAMKASMIIAHTWTICGVAGNIMIIIVFTRPAFIKLSTNLYFITIAVVDIIHLISVLEVFAIWYHVPDIMWPANWLDIGCMLHKFNVYLLPQISSGLLVAATGDRMIAVLVPHKVKLWITRKSTITVIFLMIIGSFVTNLHFFWNSYALRYDKVSSCQVRYDKVPGFPEVYLVFNYAGPALLIAVGNVLILKKIFASASKRTKMATSDSKDQDKTQQMTYMLIGISAMYMVCTLPLGVYVSLYSYTWKVPTKVSTQVNWEVWQKFLYMLYYVNTAANFWVYTASGKRFRDEVKRLLRIGKPQGT